MKELTVSRSEFARLIGVTPDHVSRWIVEGLPVVSTGSGRGNKTILNLVEALPWVSERQRAGKLNEARARKELAQAIESEQRVAMRAGKLLPADEVEQQLAKRVNATRSMLLSWQTMLSDRVFRAATTDGLPGVERELKGAVYEVLHELAAMPTPI